MRPVNGTAMAVPVSRVTSPPAEAVGSTRVMHPHMHRMRLVLRSGPTSSTLGPSYTAPHNESGRMGLGRLCGIRTPRSLARKLSR